MIGYLFVAGLAGAGLIRSVIAGRHVVSLIDTAIIAWCIARYEFWTKMNKF